MEFSNKAEDDASANADTLILACMDRRLNSEIDRIGGGTAVVVRNAGADVGLAKVAIERILEQGNIGNVLILPHLDCGAMGLVAGSLLDKKRVDDQVYSGLVRQFEGSFRSRNELESEVNPMMQRHRLEDIINGRDIGIEVRCLDPSRLNPGGTDGTHSLAIMNPSASAYEAIFKSAERSAGGMTLGMASTYVVQPFDAVSARIAVESLGIKNVAFIAANRREAEGFKADAIFLGRQKYSSGASINIVDLTRRRIKE